MENGREKSLVVPCNTLRPVGRTACEFRDSSFGQDVRARNSVARNILNMNAKRHLGLGLSTALAGASKSETIHLCLCRDTAAGVALPCTVIMVVLRSSVLTSMHLIALTLVLIFLCVMLGNVVVILPVAEIFLLVIIIISSSSSSTTTGISNSIISILFC